MTDRERLVELLKNKLNCIGRLDVKCEECAIDKRCTTYILADYLLENGVIVPPCKIGDNIYKIFEGDVLDYEVICIEKQCDEIYLYTCNAKYRVKNGILYNESSNKPGFLSKEEAEKALKAREKE